jgi:hypothetical protein
MREVYVRDNIHGLIPEILRVAGLRDLHSPFSTFGCLRVWAGRKQEISQRSPTGGPNAD